MTTWTPLSPMRKPDPAPGNHRRSEGVLVVLLADDKEDDYLLVKKAFEAGPISVDLRWVTDGVEAVNYLLRRGHFEVPESSPRPDLILLGLVMPRKDGLETLKDIKGTRELNRIPVVLLASSEKQLHEASGFRLGSDSFIVKPYDIDELTRITGNLHEHYFALVCLPGPGKTRSPRPILKDPASPAGWRRAPGGPAVDYPEEKDIPADATDGAVCCTIERKLTELELAKAGSLVDSEIMKRKRAERALVLNEARLDALLALSRMSGTAAGRVADFALEEQVKLTGSEAGWLGLVEEDQKHVTFRRKGEIEAGNSKMQLSVEMGGIFADAVRERKTLVVNDCAQSGRCNLGFSEGNATCRRLLVTPLIEGGRVKAVAMVANKHGNYDTADEKYHLLMLKTMWKLIELEEALKNHAHTEVLAAMGSALACVAHDMKSPLTAIGGFVSLVRNRMDGENPDRGKLEIVIRQTRRLEAMIGNMLDFSRPVDLDKSLVGVDEIVGESISLLDTEAKERQLSLIGAVEPNLPRAFVDPFRIEQALVNLVVNGIHSSPEGESVVIRVYSRQADLIFDVIDHGVGICPENSKDIFTPFFTTKKDGTGLGLCIVKKIVEAHNGRITPLPNDDKGLTFRVEIPECLARGKAVGRK